MAITIDGTTYNVGIKVVNRKVDVLDKYAERTEDGVLQREIIGVYYNVDVECGMSRFNVADYNALFLKLSEPVEFHTITDAPGAPTGYGTFSCYFANIRDEAYKHKSDGTQYFRNLSFSVIARSPARVP